MGRFPFVLSDGRFYIRLGRGNSMPVALVQFRSDYLAHVGAVAALTEATSVVASLAMVEGVETVVASTWPSISFPQATWKAGPAPRG